MEWRWDHQDWGRPGDLAQGRKPSGPVCGSPQGARGGLGPVSVPRVRQVIFTLDLGSSWAAEER